MSAAIASGRSARLRPRRHEVVFFVRRRSIPLAVGAVGLGLGLAFAAGHVVGRRGVPAESSALAPPPAAPAIAAAPAPATTPPVAEPAPPTTPTPPAPATTASAALARPPAPLALLSTSSTPPARGYGVQLGAFPSHDEAIAFLERSRGALGAWPVYLAPVELKGKGTWHRVRAGRFEALKEAQALRERLASGGLDGLVVAYP